LLLKGAPGASRVLVVDDHLDTVTLFEAYLQFRGFQVVTATNVGDALRQASSGVDAITTDLAMPGMDGGALIRQVRGGHNATVPIVAVTGQVLDSATLTRAAIDCCRLFQKPVDVCQLADTLRVLIDGCVHDCAGCPHRREQIVEPHR